MAGGDKKTAIVVGTVVIAGAIALAYYLTRDDDEERPPIIVKNGSVIFESPVDWTEDGSDPNWTTDQPKGHNVNGFDVSVENPVSGDCTGLEGKTVLIRRTPDNTPLHVNDGGGKPRVGPKGQLNRDNSGTRKTLTDQAGDLVSVQVQNKTCMLDESSIVTIQPKR